MSLELFGHPFSSYTWKVLIPLWMNHTPFTFRMIDGEHPENGEELRRRWPFGRFPLLLDGDAAIPESTPIIEWLQVHHPGAHVWIPEGDAGLRVRFLDRIFDNEVMGPMQRIVGDRLRPAENRDPFGVDRAKAQLRTSYAWLENELAGPWAAGSDFTLADCAAAPSLFYADWVEPIGDGHPRLAAYRARLLAQNCVMRAVDDARPYRDFFPGGAPDRD